MKAQCHRLASEDVCANTLEDAFNNCTYIYAYRHPTSPAGMWLPEHRPSTYIVRFKCPTATNNDSC
jgi:hypothetical protein